MADIPSFDEFSKKQAIPSFDEFQKPSAPAGPAPAIPLNAGIVPAPKPQGFGANLSQWASDAADDMRLGTGRTFPGRALQAVHATPLNSGVSPKTADYMASPALGTLRATKGAGELMQPGQRMQGLKDVGGGILDAAQMPLSLTGPEASATVAGKGIDMIPNAERAGRNFQTVMSAAKDVPVDLTAASHPALRAQELRESGASMPGVVNKFLQRTTAPGSNPLTYEQARDFASNAGRLSADESSRMIPPMKAQVSRLSQALNDANAKAAESAGVGPQYQSAMTEYRRAKALQDAGQSALKFGKKAAPYVVGGGILGAAARHLGN
jgi:hypothetical protein